jgi:hypothetical protein
MTPFRTIDFLAGAARAIIRAEEATMDVNSYLLECLVRERLQTERAMARRAAAAAAVQHSGGIGSWRNRLGHALIRLGRWLASEPARRARHA